jgi:hypothetical protein
MARRRKDQGGGLLLLVAVVVAAVAVVGPFAISGWAIYAELRARKFRGASRGAELIHPAEAAEVEQWEARLAHLEARSANLEQAGAARGLLKRADGLFDARNVEGRSLNQQLESLALEQRLAFANLEELKDRLARRMETWLKARAGLVGARAGLLAFVGVFVLMTLGRLAEQNLAPSLSLVMFGSGTDGSERIFASAVATAAAGLGIWIGGSVARASLS